ncbi:hypothetical protein HYC85_027890 [Camellia sinensis]|uniref:(S)-2-hydroxy-acid oxidase n=1 Tax=Camellia sinensis TaxID=4442 RepID=A0A7J7FTW0_CAMSI|nr:hypothetical protein HYC85_027890 [Camellia sinensis]
MYFDYYNGGAQDQHTLRENMEAFCRITLNFLNFRLRVLIDVSRIDMSTTILGYPTLAPIMIAPTGLHKFVHPEGEVATAKAAAACNTIMLNFEWAPNVFWGGFEEVTCSLPRGKSHELMATETNAQTSTTVVAAMTPTPSPVVTVPVNHGEKPEKFSGTDFKRWQQKMLFYLTTLNLARFLREDAPILKEDKTDRQVVAAVDAWKHADFLCRNYVLNRLDNKLYNVYSPIKTAKKLWESLEKKYKTEDAGSKKFVVGRFLDFVIVDSKTVISQAQDFQLILHDIHAEVVFEANLVGNPKEWWVDTGATRHICADKKMFTSYSIVDNGEQLFMGNSSTSKVEGQGKIVLNMTSGKELTLNNVLYPAVLEGYCDANWILDTKDSKSTSGYVFTLGGAAVSWKSSKQTCIARSTMESEFIALDKAGEEAEWLRHFLEDIPIWPKPVPAICIHCDSQSAIGRAQSHMYNGKPSGVWQDTLHKNHLCECELGRQCPLRLTAPWRRLLPVAMPFAFFKHMYSTLFSSSKFKFLHRNLYRSLGFTVWITAQSLQDNGSKFAAIAAETLDPSLCWKDIDWLRSVTSLPILVKGVLTAEDATKAMEVGVAGIVVSNHGARQLDYSPATITVLEEVVRAVGGKIPVLIDGGVRRGTDIFKALALGAQALMIGRPVLYGLAAKGENGVRRVIEMLKDELELTMALSGCPTVKDITRSHVRTEYDRFNCRL